jgi:RNA polymerase sigma factor (TIGR02999 family)
MDNAQSITLLLRDLAGGEKEAFDRLMPLVYAELRRMAQAQLRNERPGHTLQPTALVHEVYARMAGREVLTFNDRAHFLGVAAHTMRKILIDYARIRNAAKRDPGRVKVSLEDAIDAGLERPSNLIALDDALHTLERQDPRLVRLIEMRYFGGLTAEETSVAMNLEVSEVRRELALAQAWLRRELDAGQSGQGRSTSSA